MGIRFKNINENDLKTNNENPKFKYGIKIFFFCFNMNNK